MTSRNRARNFNGISGQPLLIGGGLLVALLSAIAWNAKYIVQPGDVGIVTLLGKAQDQPMREGINFKAPFVSSVYALSVKPQAYSPDGRIAAGSSDLQELKSEIQVEWRVDPDQAVEFYRQFRTPDSFQARYLASIVVEAYNTSTASFTAESAVQQRSQLSAEFAEIVAQNTAQYPIIITRATVTDIDFNEEFANAIEQKQIAEQRAKEAVFRAQEAEQDAQAAVNRARGEAESARLRAESLRLQGGSLVIQEQAIQAWREGGAQMPEVLVVGDEGSQPPFIFDLPSSGSTISAQ
ncbi:MAG: prohibitin family protein [Cyanobacteria bacterium J06626_18]